MRAIYQGFNPCFPGSSAERRAGHGGSSRLLLVSILVFLDQALKVYRRLLVEKDSRVSILVFLDQALKARQHRSVKLAFLSFNPCFPGSSAERHQALGGPANHPAVSILVFLDQALKEQPSASVVHPGQVSILVFLDQALKENEKFIQFLKTFVFQSLFSWIKR